MTGEDILAGAIRIQGGYWTPDAAAREALLSRPLDSLGWPELLRLHHLNCMGLVLSCRPNPLEDAEAEPAGPAPGPARDLCLRLIERLLDRRSPFRPRPAVLLQGDPTSGKGGRPEQQGVVGNASLTHLGCLEVIRLDARRRPTAVDFIPFDNLRGAAFTPPALFRFAKLFFDDGRPDEIALAPLLYGISWMSRSRFDQDGSLTRFCCHVNDGPGPERAIGIGHQDFCVTGTGGGSPSLVGFGSVGEFIVGLETADPRFDQKCRARGIDPDEARRRP